MSKDKQKRDTMDRRVTTDRRKKEIPVKQERRKTNDRRTGVDRRQK